MNADIGEPTYELRINQIQAECDVYHVTLGLTRNFNS
jgi:hypothetical protein